MVAEKFYAMKYILILIDIFSLDKIYVYSLKYIFVRQIIISFRRKILVY